MQALLRVQIQAQTREIRAERQRHQIGIRFRSPNERQQAHHAELVVHHGRWYVCDLA